MRKFLDQIQRPSHPFGRVFFKRLSIILLMVALAVALLPALSASARPAQQTTNLALNKTTTASSVLGGNTAAMAFDGNATGTRWESAQGVDPQWLQVDLGATYTITSVILRWETAAASAYQIQTSASAAGPWTNIYSTTTSTGGVQTLAVSGSGRYIRMNGTARTTQWGYSLWEMEVYGNGGAAPTATVTRTATPGPTATRTNTSVGPTATPSRTFTATAPAAGCGATNVALNKTATSSSNENAGTTPNLAVDGNVTGTRWSSAASDPQWIQIDLGSTQSICHVKLTWEAAYGKSYQIQTSNDAATWTSIYTTTTGDGGVDDLTGLSGSGRYIRMNGTVRGTGYGYSLWEFEVYSGSVSATITSTLSPTLGPSLTPTHTLTRTLTPIAGACRTANMALNRPATSSSNENVGTTPNLTVDGNVTGTRWSSAVGDPQWIQIDLGSIQDVCHVKLTWEAAYGTAYQIQLSNDAATWSTIYSTTTGDGGVDDLTGLTGSGRYIRMYGTARATAYGYSLWEFEVYISGGQPTPTAAPTATPPGGVDFWGDTSTIPVAHNVMTFKFLNRTYGKYPDSQVFWSFNGQSHSIADQPTFDMPANSSGRMYFGLGVPPVAGDPTTYWDFIEFTIGPASFNGNTTRVDAFGLKLAFRLHAADGYDVSVGENLNTFVEDRAVTFQRFVDAMPAEFKSCGQIHAPYRIVEPGGCGFNAGGPYATYYDSYINTMWANNGITIPKPGPNGAGLGAYPDLSAAIFRHVGAAAGSFNPDGTRKSPTLWSDPSTFYQAAPAMYYAKFWHDNAINGLAYGFPYDDAGGFSSDLDHANPQYMIIAIGW